MKKKKNTNLVAVLLNFNAGQGWQMNGLADWFVSLQVLGDFGKLAEVAARHHVTLTDLFDERFAIVLRIKSNQS